MLNIAILRAIRAVVRGAEDAAAGIMYSPRGEVGWIIYCAWHNGSCR